MGSNLTTTLAVPESFKWAVPIVLLLTLGLELWDRLEGWAKPTLPSIQPTECADMCWEYGLYLSSWSPNQCICQEKE